MTWPRRAPALTLVLLAVLIGLALPPAAPAQPAAAADGDVAPGRVIVKMRGRGAAALQAAATRYGALSVEDRPRIGAQLWRVPAGQEAEVARRAAGRADVEYAEPDRIQRLKSVPNDPFYGSLQWNLPKVNAPQAWDITIGDSSVIVAVIDSGFDVTHPDRPASLRLGCDYVSWREIGQVGACPPVHDDQNGHGTHVGGIVAARQNNGLYISGLAPGVTLLSIRTADADGSSFVSDVSTAVREATDAGARVINLSLGGTSNSITQQAAINYAISHGVVVVAAAGNEYQEGNPTSYPAAYPGVIAVASASDTDQHSSFSNTGSYVAIAAPGGSASGPTDDDVRHWITSLYPVSQDGYALVNGTSQATPHVAATFGLMFSTRPTLSASDAIHLIESTARPLGGSVPNSTFGYGYLDAGAAVRAAQQSGATPTPTPIPATPTATPTPGPPLGTPVPGTERMFVPVASRNRSGL